MNRQFGSTLNGKDCVSGPQLSNHVRWLQVAASLVNSGIKMGRLNLAWLLTRKTGLGRIQNEQRAPLFDSHTGCSLLRVSGLTDAPILPDPQPGLLLQGNPKGG